MQNFNHAILTANTFKDLPGTIQRYIRNNYLIINPDDNIISYFSADNIVTVEYKNIILTVDFK